MAAAPRASAALPPRVVASLLRSLARAIVRFSEKGVPLVAVASLGGSPSDAYPTYASPVLRPLHDPACSARVASQAFRASGSFFPAAADGAEDGFGLLRRLRSQLQCLESADAPSRQALRLWERLLRDQSQSAWFRA